MPSSQPTDESSPRELSKDAIFDILKASRRCEVLHYLYTSGESASLGTLAEHVAAMENDIECKALTSVQRKRMYIALSQGHLPKMANHGVIEFDHRGEIRSRAISRALQPYLYLVPEGVTEGDVMGPLAGIRERLRKLIDREVSLIS